MAIRKRMFLSPDMLSGVAKLIRARHTATLARRRLERILRGIG